MKLPITNMMASIPYNVSLSDSKIKYFTYYHNSRDSFYIIQMVKAGNSYLYVNEIKINDNIEDIFVKGI